MSLHAARKRNDCENKRNRVPNGFKISGNGRKKIAQRFAQDIMTVKRALSNCAQWCKRFASRPSAFSAKIFSKSFTSERSLGTEYSCILSPVAASPHVSFAVFARSCVLLVMISYVLRERKHQTVRPQFLIQGDETLIFITMGPEKTTRCMNFLRRNDLWKTNTFFWKKGKELRNAYWTDTIWNTFRLLPHLKISQSLQRRTCKRNLLPASLCSPFADGSHASVSLPRLLRSQFSDSPSQTLLKKMPFVAIWKKERNQKPLPLYQNFFCKILQRSSKQTENVTKRIPHWRRSFLKTRTSRTRGYIMVSRRSRTTNGT